MTTAQGEAAWRPIETAPKDKTHILVACTNGCVYGVMWGSLPDDEWVVIGGPDLCVSRLSVGVVRRTPTHWMPMPAPPTAADKPPTAATAQSR